MTQTIYNITENTQKFISIDVYYHPNNAAAGYEDSQARYRYTVWASTFTWNEFLEHIKNGDNNELALCEYAEIIEMFKKVEEDDNGEKSIWRVGSVNGHDDYNGFFAAKDEAETNLFKQYC